MKNFSRLFPQIILTLFIGLSPLFAAEENEEQSHEEDPNLYAAKETGSVCELPNGEVRAISNDSGTAALVAEINGKRLKAYEAIVQKKGYPIDLVRGVAAQKIAQRHPGHDHMCH